MDFSGTLRVVVAMASRSCGSALSDVNESPPAAASDPAKPDYPNFVRHPGPSCFGGRSTSNRSVLLASPRGTPAIGVTASHNERLVRRTPYARRCEPAKHEPGVSPARDSPGAPRGGMGVNSVEAACGGDWLGLGSSSSDGDSDRLVIGFRVSWQPSSMRAAVP